jgi:hypothetical protein
MEKIDLIPYLCVWAVALPLVIWQTWRAAGAGLMLAYSFQLFMLYWIGAMVHALPWAELPEDDYVYLGIQQSTYAVVAFALGSVALGPWLAKRFQKGRAQEQIVPDLGLPRAYITYGIVSYFILAPTIGRVSGFNAVAAVGSQLVVVGCCLNCWKAWNTGGKPALFRALAYTLLIPAVTVVFAGFLGFGVMALSVIFIFCAQFFRPRWLLVAGFLVATYFGMGVYTTYMKGRDEIRASVWGEESLSERAGKFIETARNFEFFDIMNPEHLRIVDVRLNQDALVGHAVEYLGNTGEYAKGGTLWEAVLAMIPRIIWPSKPMTAGSGSGHTGLVSQFTGLTFAETTSVGVGPVMELYANFGTPCVVVGFIVLGVMVKLIDTMAGFHLSRGDWAGFGAWCLVGISFLNVSGSFVEVSMGAMASLLLVRFVNGLLEKRKQAQLTALPDESLNPI